MFGVGLHFSVKDLLAVKRIAIPGALAQIALATLMGMGLAAALGWNLIAGLVFGLSLSVASTVVLLRPGGPKQPGESGREDRHRLAGGGRSGDSAGAGAAAAAGQCEPGGPAPLSGQRY